MAGGPTRTVQIEDASCAPLRELAIAELARRQHSVVALAQLTGLGLSPSAVRSRAACGRLRRLRRGVYAVGPGLLTARGRWMAAVMAYGGGAVLSYLSAAALWGLMADRRGNIHVSLPTRSARSRDGIEVHGTVTMSPRDVTMADGIPCTSVARTLLDLAEYLDDRGVERAIEQAEVLRLFDRRAVEEVLVRGNGRCGAGRLHRVLTAARDPAPTESELEEAFLALCRVHGIARPEVGIWLPTQEGYVKADFRWRSSKLVVETDGYRYHRGPAAFERDHRRDQLLQLAGWDVRRFTWRQVTTDAGFVAATVAAVLAEPG